MRAAVQGARDAARHKAALGQMRVLLRTARPCLSRSADWERVQARLDICLARLQRDITSGDFAPHTGARAEFSPALPLLNTVPSA